MPRRRSGTRKRSTPTQDGTGNSMGMAWEKEIHTDTVWVKGSHTVMGWENETPMDMDWVKGTHTDTVWAKELHMATVQERGNRMAMDWEKGILTDMGWGNVSHMVMALGSDILCEEIKIYVQQCLKLHELQ